jgi:hypothetical protein
VARVTASESDTRQALHELVCIVSTRLYIERVILLPLVAGQPGAAGYPKRFRAGRHRIEVLLDNIDRRHASDPQLPALFADLQNAVASNLADQRTMSAAVRDRLDSQQEERLQAVLHRRGRYLHDPPASPPSRPRRPIGQRGHRSAGPAPQPHDGPMQKTDHNVRDTPRRGQRGEGLQRESTAFPARYLTVTFASSPRGVQSRRATPGLPAMEPFARRSSWVETAVTAGAAELAFGRHCRAEPAVGFVGFGRPRPSGCAR